MASISMGESKWRMLRRVLRKKRFQYPDARNMSRNDRVHFEWLVKGGFFKDLGGGWYAVTDKGRESAELGFYEV
jgi:hypothetical protein